MPTDALRSADAKSPGVRVWKWYPGFADLSSMWLLVFCAIAVMVMFCKSAGQFGTRLQGGKDSASARYIFTRMTKLTRHLFNGFDDRLLNYLNEEGQQIEPEW